MWPSTTMNDGTVYSLCIVLGVGVLQGMATQSQNDSKIGRLLFLWTSLSFCVFLVQSACLHNKFLKEKAEIRRQACSLEANRQENTFSDANCRYNCKYSNRRYRFTQRFGHEESPFLFQYPIAPSFTEDLQFCLVFTNFYWSPTSITYTIQMGEYTCLLHLWNPDGKGKDIIQFQNQRGESEYLVRFSLQLYGHNDHVWINTTYHRLSHTSWKFQIDKTHQSFDSEIVTQMESCLKALEIEGTHKMPTNIQSSTDRCIPQEFRLSYPTQCTSLSFDGGWKRGQTVTSATWSFSLVNHKFDCLHVASADPYNVDSEFTDRYINVNERQLRQGLNRICNEFLFTTTFGSEANPKEYGPYPLKICGYIRVEEHLCIKLKPLSLGKDIQIPVGGELTLDPRDTIEQGKSPEDFRFDWTCTELQPAAGTPCNISSGDDGVLVFNASVDFQGKKLRLLLNVTYRLGTSEEANGLEIRTVSVVASNNLQISLLCLANCKRHRISVLPVVITVDCESCEDVDELTYQWNITDITHTNNFSLISGKELKNLVADGNLTRKTFMTTAAGNIFLERIFQICVKVVKISNGYFGEACVELNYTGAPHPLPDDKCIVSPFNGLPGFLDWSYRGLCKWRGNMSESLLYKIFTYDVGLPESKRSYNLIAFSDISRMPSLELPFGNPDYDYELGVIFQISDENGLTYIYNLNEAFKKNKLVFKVRKPVNYAYRDKIRNIMKNLLDRRQSGMFGSRQGVFNVAALVASVVESDAGFSKDKRIKIREDLLYSLRHLASVDFNTLLQLTPLMDVLTKYEDEISDNLEAVGAEILFTLTKGLVKAAATDFSTAIKLSHIQFDVLERFSARNWKSQKSAKDSEDGISMEDREKLLKQASYYTSMHLNIGAGFAASNLFTDTSHKEEKTGLAIVINWVKLKQTTKLNVVKPRTEKSSFGGSVYLEAAALNISEEVEVNVIMAVSERNLFALANGSSDVNMPMVNFELQKRITNEPIRVSNLRSPVDIFLERPAKNDDFWFWQEINITEPVNYAETFTKYKLLKEKIVYLEASATHAILLRFKLSNKTFTVNLSAFFLSDNGNRRSVFQNVDYPRKSGLKNYRNITQASDVIFLPMTNTSDTQGRYELVVSILPVVDGFLYEEPEVPVLLMLLANASCHSWNATDLAWQISGCEVADMTSFEMLHCQCYHLSIFSGGILVEPNPANLLEVELFLEFFNNPAIVSVVVFIWLVYFILIYWAREEDWRDTFRSRVAVLEDSKATDKWAYLVCCVTGWWINSGTTAKVFMYIKGTRGMSRVHRLTDDEQELFVKGAENWFILTTPSCLGKVKSVVVWHDSSGSSPAWFVKEVFLQDINTGHSWHCLYNDWISVEHGTGDLCVEIPALSPKQIHKRRIYHMVLKTSIDIRNSHIWLSIALKSCFSTFTRVQRVTCVLCLLLTTMLSNLMFYGIPSDNPKDQISKGPLKFNLRSIIIGIQSSLVVFPINVILVQLFSLTSTQPTERKYPGFTLKEPTGVTKHQNNNSAKTTSENEVKTVRNKPLESRSPQDTNHSNMKIASEYFVPHYGALEINEESESNSSDSLIQSDHSSSGFIKGFLTGIKKIKASVLRADPRELVVDDSSGGTFKDYSLVKTDQSVCCDQCSSAHNLLEQGNFLSYRLLSTPTQQCGKTDFTKFGSFSQEETWCGQCFNNYPSSGTNLTNESSFQREGQEFLTEKHFLPHPSRHLTERLSYIMESVWFQNAAAFLRHNLIMLIDKRRKQAEGNSEFSWLSSGSESHLTPKQETSCQSGSYIGRLKAKKQRQFVTQTVNKKEKRNMESSIYNTSCQKRRTSSEESFHGRTYLGKLKANRRPTDGKLTGNSIAYSGSGDHAWISIKDNHNNESCFKKHEENKDCLSDTCSALPGKSFKGTTSQKEKLSRLRFKPKKEGIDQSKHSNIVSEEKIPFETIRYFYDYEYEQAQRKGSKALKAFRRQAAQCIAEDLLNSNANASFESSGNGELNSVKRDAQPKNAKDTVIEVDAARKGEVKSGPGYCARKIRPWTLYLAWFLALCVAIGSSWVVMLYGLKLGYQNSVDWLSSFFTGWFQNAFLLQPFKVMILSILYIFVLDQHVNFQNESGVSVYDENNELLHIKMLKEYEARRLLLDGMWTAMDYEYPIPRSKAKDIRLKLEQDSKARQILRESFIWVVFLIAVAIACLGHTKVEDAYNTNNIIKNMLEKGVYANMSFEDIRSIEDIWDYMIDTMLPTLYAYPNKTTASMASIVLGSIRVRQVRQMISRGVCESVIRSEFSDFLQHNHCRPAEYSFDSRDFVFDWNKPLSSDDFYDLDPLSLAWRYRTASKLQENFLWGSHGVYEGGGYSINLPSTYDEANETLAVLKNQSWINRNTRALIISINLYTVSKDLISCISILCEWSPEGAVYSKLFLHTVKLHFYYHPYENIVSSAEIVWMTMMSVNLFYEMQQLMTAGEVIYMSSGWAWLELLNFTLSLTAVVVHLVRIVLVESFLNELANLQYRSYISFAIPRLLDQILEVLKSVILMLAILKVFKVLRFNRYFRVLLQSFIIAKQSIINHAIIAFIVVMAFGSSFLILYGSSLEDYSSLIATMQALFNFGIGEGDFLGMREVQPILGPILYFLFILLFTNIVLSFFVTFIIESFNVSRVYVQLNADEQHVLRYIRRTFRLLIGATPKIKQVKRERHTHPFKAASFCPK